MASVMEHGPFLHDSQTVSWRYIRVLSGEHARKTTFIPRITLKSKASDIPFDFRRLQVPVRLAFAISINKSERQSVTYVGLNLQTAVFTHGQLYAALSRCTSSCHIKVLVKDTPT